MNTDFKSVRDKEAAKLISMSTEKKKRLIGLFTEDVSYNYHIIKVLDPKGFFIYLKRSDTSNTIDTLDVTVNSIAEELVTQAGVKFDKASSSILFTEETNVKNLRKKLNGAGLKSNKEFSEFIESIKDEHKKLEIQDFLLMKKDPAAYEEARKKEYIEHQIDLANRWNEQEERREAARKKLIESYNNNFKLLLRDTLSESIYLDREGFDIQSKIYNIVQGIAHPESWVKKDGYPFMGAIRVISIDGDKMDIRISDAITTYTATLRFVGSEFMTEQSKLEDNDQSVAVMTDYELLSFLYDIQINEPEWQYKNEKERTIIVIKKAIEIVEAQNEKERTAAGTGKKYVGLAIDKKDHETAKKLRFTDSDWDLKYEEFTKEGKEKYDNIIKKRVEKLINDGIPYASFSDENQDMFFVHSEDEHYLHRLFPEFERHGVNDEIFELIKFDVDTLIKDQQYVPSTTTPTNNNCGCGDNCGCKNGGDEEDCDCGDDCSCKTEGHSECECGDPNCNCSNPDHTEEVDDDTIKSVKCQECGKEEQLVFSFTINKKIHICMDISEKSLEIMDDDKNISNVKQLKKYIEANEIKVSNIIAECPCIQNEVGAIVSFGKHQVIDYAMFIEDRNIYGEYLLTKLKNNF